MYTCFKTTAGTPAGKWKSWNLNLQRLAHCWSVRHSSWVPQDGVGTRRGSLWLQFLQGPSGCCMQISCRGRGQKREDQRGKCCNTPRER